MDGMAKRVQELETAVKVLSKAVDDLNESIGGHTKSQNTFVEWARMKEEALKPSDVVSLFASEIITAKEARAMLRIPTIEEVKRRKK